MSWMVPSSSPRSAHHRDNEAPTSPSRREWAWATSHPGRSSWASPLSTARWTRSARRLARMRPMVVLVM
eukprot:5008713-Pyramimonas_sp.AAC.2